HDQLYRGSDEYFYRLTISLGPHIDFIFPPSGPAGTTAEYTIFGRNLPGGKTATDMIIDGKPLERLAVSIDVPSGDPSSRLDTGSLIRPSDAMLDGFDYRLETSNGLSNPFLLTFATAPLISEQEPNDKPAQAQKIEVPCEVAGQFFPANDVDWMVFSAKKGE